MRIFLFFFLSLPCWLYSNSPTPDFQKPSVVSDKKYQQLFMPLENRHFFSTENACTIKRLEANTWLLTSPEHHHLQKASIFLGDIKGQKGLGLYRLKSLDYNYLWPLFFESSPDIPEKSLLILWEEAPSTYGAVVPVMGQKALVELSAEKGKLMAHIDTAVDKEEETAIPLAVAGYDSNPYRLIKRLLSQAKNHSPFPPKIIHKTPQWTQYLGWSSEKVWPQGMNNQDFLTLIKDMEKLELPFHSFLIDSWWQDINDQHQLRSFELHPELIMGLKPLVQELKSRLKIKYVGVSHSIFGTTHGLDPFSSIGKSYQLLPKGLVHPNDYKSFIHLLHAPLQEAGVDYILLKDLSQTLKSMSAHLPVVAGAQEIQKQFYLSYDKTFEKGLIKDQAHNSLHLLNSEAHDVIRVASSRRFGMEKNFYTQLYQSAYNALLVGSVAIPDWGSFSSNSKDSYAQAAARVISGGPLIVNDAPQNLDNHLLAIMALPGGQCFSWDHYATPTRSSLFFDPLKDQPLMLFNSQKDVKTLAIFNLKPQDTAYLVGPQDVDIAPEKDKRVFALYSFKEGYLGKVDAKDWIQRKVKAHEWDILSFLPVHNDIAVLGNPRSLNPYGWIENYQWLEKDGVSQLNISTKATGPITVITYKHPYAIYHKGVKLPFNWDGKVLEIDTPIGEGKLNLEIFFYKK